jgi:hypothetical protein
VISNDPFVSNNHGETQGLSVQHESRDVPLDTDKQQSSPDFSRSSRSPPSLISESPSDIGVSLSHGAQIELIDVWFACEYHVFPLPFLHRRTVLRRLKSDNPPHPLLLNAIFALGAQFSQHPEVTSLRSVDPAARYLAGEAFYSAARSYALESIDDEPQLSTVQALILLSVCVTNYIQTT